MVNFIFPNLTLLRWVEILNKENQVISLEFLQTCLSFYHKKIKKLLINSSQFSMIGKTNFLKRPFVQYMKCINMVSLDDAAKEEKLVLLRKVKIYLYSDILVKFKMFENLEQTFYSIFPLIDF